MKYHLSQYSLSSTICLLASAHIYVQAEDKAQENPIIVGQGTFQYEYQPRKLKLPDSILDTWGHAHGLTRDKNGNIYLTYTTTGTLDEKSYGLVVFDAEGNFLNGLGDHDIARGTPHGLEGREEDGQFMLYHTNNDGRFFKTDAKGHVIWKNNSHDILPNYDLQWLQSAKDSILGGLYSGFSYNIDSVPGEYMPCNLAFHPDGKTVFMADCYGLSYIHTFASETGKYKGFSFGGSGTELNQYNSPHGLIFDTRYDALAIADRGNHRIQYTNLKGETIKVVEDEAIVLPCDFDILGDHMLVPDLAGHLTILDKGNQVVSKLDVKASLKEQGVVHPHDAIFLENYDIVVATWDPATLTYWKRIETQPSSNN